MVPKRDQLQILSSFRCLFLYLPVPRSLFVSPALWRLPAVSSQHTLFAMLSTPGIERLQKRSQPFPRRFPWLRVSFLTFILSSFELRFNFLWFFSLLWHVSAFAAVVITAVMLFHQLMFPWKSWIIVQWKSSRAAQGTLILSSQKKTKTCRWLRRTFLTFSPPTASPHGEAGGGSPESGSASVII